MIKIENIPASFWMAISMILISGNYALVRFVSINNTTSSIVFYRSLFSILILFVLLRPHKFIGAFRTKSLKLNIARGLCGVVYLFLSVFALKILNLSMFTALMYLSPIMIIFLSCLFLKENWRSSYIISSFLGLVGMILIIRPTGELNIVYGIAAILAAFMDAVTVFLSKKAAQNDGPQTMIMFYITTTLIASIHGAKDLRDT